MPFFDIDTDPAFCCNLEGCSLTASLISWTSPVAHYAVCNITYLAKYITTLVSLFSPCPSPLCRVLLQAWGRYIYCTLGQDWKSTVSTEEWLCYFFMCNFHFLFFVTIVVFVFTFVFVFVFVGVSSYRVADRIDQTAQLLSHLKIVIDMPDMSFSLPLSLSL